MAHAFRLGKIHPVSDFVRNYKSFFERMRDSREPEVLTVNGKAEFVLVDAETFEEMRQAWEEARFIQAVNQGIESMNAQTGKPNAQAFRDIRETLGL